MTNANFPANAVSSLVQKQEDVMRVCIRKKFASVFLKKYYTMCSVKKGKCGDCEDLPPKCITDGN